MLAQKWTDRRNNSDPMGYIVITLKAHRNRLMTDETEASYSVRSVSTIIDTRKPLAHSRFIHLELSSLLVHLSL